MRQFFRSFAQRSAEIVGSPGSFLVGLIAILVWAASGPYFHYSDTWQLVINTGTSIITFLMVFLIQSTQNRDAKVMHLKLDELIRAVTAARNHLVHLENLSDDELEALEKEFQRLHEKLNKNGKGRNSPPSATPAKESSDAANGLQKSVVLDK
jgi:low affinity Fe/Cu permease